MRSNYIMRGRQSLLNAIVEGPPPDPGETWFLDDLQHLARDELLAERQRLRLRQLLTPEVERVRWPGSWFAARLQRIEAILNERRS